MAADLEPSHQYSIIFCRSVTDGSKGAVQQHGSAYETKGNEFLQTEKNGTH